jgi:two-component system, NarL family, response regulator
MSKPSGKLKVMLVEDHILIRMGLDSVSQLERDIEVAGQAEAGEDAVACFRKCRPHIVIVDMRLPGEMDGVQTITALRQEFGPVAALVLSSFASDDDVYRAVQAGASGYVLKDMPLPTLVEAIRAVHAGRKYFPPGISERLADRMVQTRLTERELTVLRAVARGMSNKEIGNAYDISEGTVKAHITNILEKLQVADRTQAVTTAIKRGLIPVD